jgi:hypothetical protein
MTKGNTKAMPAKGKMPNLPTYQVSAMLTNAAAVMASMLGSAKRQMVGAIGAVVREFGKVGD